MPQRCWAENAMPQWNAGASKASVDRLCDYRRTDINGNHLTPGPEWGQHQAARALIKGKKKTSMVEGGGGTWCNFVWSPHWPCVLSARGPLITFKFLWAHEKTRHRFDKKWKREKKKKNYGNTKWGGMRLWSSAFWYLVESLCNNILKVLRIHTGLQRKGYSTEKGRGGTYWTFYSNIEKCKSWYSIPMHCTSHTNVTCFYPCELDVYAKEKRETVAIRRNLRMTIVGIIMTGSLRWM